jgi:iron complex transport system substrate-binding protein
MRFPVCLTACAVLIASCIVPSSAQLTLTDDLQRQVTLPRPASRIVSLAPSITESLFAIGAGDQVVGVTDYCNYPPEALTCRRVGGMINPNIETIVGLSPDLIVVSMEGNLRQDFLTLTDLNIPVFVCNPRTLDGINRSLRQLGSLTGRLRDARHLTDSLAARAAALHIKGDTRHIPMLLLVSLQPLMAVGSGTFLNELIVAAGGNNLASSTGLTYPTLSREMVLTADPEVLLITEGAISSLNTLTSLYPEWARLSAVRNGRVHLINPDLTGRPGPRAVEGLALLKSLLHTGHP